MNYCKDCFGAAAGDCEVCPHEREVVKQTIRQLHRKRGKDMTISLKKGVDPEILRDYGFKTGKEWGALGVGGLSGEGYEYCENWFYKLKLRSADRADLTSEGEPRVSLCVRNDGTFYAECIPEYSYHVSGSELSVITDAIFDLATAGLIEKI